MTVYEAKQELLSLRAERCGCGGSIAERIRAVGRPYSDMLFYRYVRAMTWREVARTMEYSSDHLRGYMNRRAIEKYASAETAPSA